MFSKHDRLGCHGNEIHVAEIPLVLVLEVARGTFEAVKSERKKDSFSKLENVFIHINLEGFFLQGNHL